MQSFSNILLEWYNPNTRNLPWKKTTDAYKIWLSEIILQQTRVEQGLPYYNNFVKNYPTVQKLAAAPLDEVLKHWEGLGYYSRARNLHFAAQQIVNEHKGKFPTDYESILKLKGIGAYTAAAIASFAYNLPYAVVDGNVFRVLSRIFDIETPIDTTQGKKQFEQLANKLLDKKNAAKYNQAIMDFGALVCKPQLPLCIQCPFSTECKALEKNKISRLPVKLKKLIKTTRHFHFLVLTYKNNIIIQQRTAQDIWKNLYQFPLIEQEKINKNSFFNYCKTHFGITPSYNFTKNQTYLYKQTLTHQYIFGYFYEISISDFNFAHLINNNIKITPINKLKNYAFPKLIREYLKDRLKFLS